MSQEMSRTMLSRSIRIALATTASLIAIHGIACSWQRIAFAAEPKSAKVSAMMKKKLDHTRELLAGLATEDYDALVRHARALDSLTLERWRADEPDDYRANLKVFRFATSELQRLAEEKNLDGATLAYVQLTTSCIACHRQMRQRGM